MIRMGLFLTLIMVTINAGLFLTGDIVISSTNNPFVTLPVELNQFQDVSADVNIVAAPVTIFGVPTQITEFAGLVISTVSSAVEIINIIVFLLTGSIQLIQLIDPSSAWGLVILAPIATIQIFYIVFMLIEIIRAIRSIIGG